MMRILRASAYIVACSVKNRARIRLRRLREPRYMIGAIAGAAYLYFTVWTRLGVRRPRRGGSVAQPFAAGAGVAVQSMAAVIGGVGLLLLAALVWIFPPSSGLLAFSEAEEQLLFPAPLSRRQLLLYRLMRSQLGLLFAAMLPAFLITNPSLQTGAASTRLLRGLALWVLFVTIRVYSAGVSLARARLSSLDRASRRAAWIPLGLLLAAVATVGIPLGAALFGSTPARSFREAASRITEVTASPWGRVALWPFVSLVRPVVSDWPWPYLTAMAGSLVVMTAAIVWLLRSDAAFQEATEAARQRRAERLTTTQVWTTRTFGWSLGLSGRTETVFLWKNAMQTLRGTNVAQAMRFLLPLTMLTVVGATARLTATQSRGAAAGLASGAIAIAAFFTLLGPMAVRSDLRGDLTHLELLKTWPLRAAALIRGELLWPTILMTVSSWLPLLCATILSAAAFPAWSITRRLSVSAAAMILAPALIGSQFMVHTGAALLFPAWVPAGKNRPRGLEAMGQRLIFLGAVVVSLVVVVGPGGIAGGIVGLAMYRVIGIVSIVPAAIVCFVAVAIEILFATEMLGGRFERIDLSQVERPD